MFPRFARLVLLVSLLCLGPPNGTLLNGTLLAATPTVGQALQLEPMQDDVTFDVPADADAQRCRIEKVAVQGSTAWVVTNANGSLLRQFVDTNRDGKIDQWRYFRNGIEVYRDIDENFNGKADQYRWLGTAGTRWGLDKNEDGKIDSWKAISAEEVTAQVIEAVKRRDSARFRNVLLSATELKQLGLGTELQTSIAQRIKTAQEAFGKLATTKDLVVDSNTKWLDFAALRPGTIPAGTRGVTKDVTVYENVVAMVESKENTAQVPIGTLIQVGEGWRITDLPLAKGRSATTQFVFFEASPQTPISAGGGDINPQTQQLVESLQAIDNKLASATTPAAIAKLNAERAGTLEKLAQAATTPEDRDMWWTQFADTVGAAAQTGAYPEGTKRLLTLRKQLEKTSQNKDLVAHVSFTHMSADYAEQLQAEDADFTKIQEQWLTQLEGFVKKFPRSSDAPEAMLQLALAKEFAADEKAANLWYTKIVSDFQSSPLAAKAAGAKRRLEAEGKQFALTGRTLQGKAFDLARLRGNVVLVHYWATWCDPCKEDMKVLKQLSQEYAGKKFTVVGVNLDSQRSDAANYLRQNPPAGAQLFEEGGLDSRLANEMGVFTLPVMFLVDQRGRIVKSQINAREIKTEVDKLIR